MAVQDGDAAPLHPIKMCLHIKLQLRKLGNFQLNELTMESPTHMIMILCPHT